MIYRYLGTIEENYHLAEIIRSNINLVQDKTKQLFTYHYKLKACLDDMKQTRLERSNTNKYTFSHEIDSLITSGNKNIMTSKVLLKDLINDAQNYDQHQQLSARSNNTTHTIHINHPINDAELRIRKNLANTLTLKYVDVLKKFQNVQNLIKEDKIKYVTMCIR